MGRLKTLAISGYGLVALITLAMASRFLTATEFFPYHAVASGTEWADLGPGLQTVVLAVLRVCGAGWLATGIALALMIAFPFARRDEPWSHVAIPTVSLTFWAITLATTLHVASTTPATPPWMGSLFCIVVTLLSATCSLLSRGRVA